MKKNQVILVLLIVLGCGFLFIKGFKTNKSVNQASAQALPSEQFDFDSYLSSAEMKLDSATKSRLKVLGDDPQDALLLQTKIVLWDSAGYPLVAAHYLYQLASLKKDEKNWFAAGSKYYMLAAQSEDSLIAAESAKKAKAALEEVIKLNDNNLDAKNALAACYIEVDQDIMKGVTLLKDVVERDSNNVQAIFTLGMLSIQSNQYDKAQQRFEKLIALQPFNAEYYFYLGEIYARSGNTKAAIATYEKCKTLLTDKEAKKEVDTIINKLKNI